MSEHPVIQIVVRGPQGAGKSTVAAAIREMLAEADIAATIVGDEEVQSSDGDAIERLYDLRGRPRALISTELLAVDTTDHRRDVAVANAVLDTLRESDVPRRACDRTGAADRGGDRARRAESTMSRRHGKKIGTLEVMLDRKKTRYKWATVEVELRFEIHNGQFYAQYEGNWYLATTKAELAAKIKIAATKSLSLEWKRYLQVDYSASAHPIADPKTGRPRQSGQYHRFEIDDDRSKFSFYDGVPFAISEIKLDWSVCEISEPYPLPEDPKKRIRSRRDVTTRACDDDDGEPVEQIGDPAEWEDDVLPAGTFLWTPEREALLREILTALSKLDQRLVDLFSGDATQLARKIDAAMQGDPSRLLAAPIEPEPPARPRPKQRHT